MAEMDRIAKMIQTNTIAKIANPPEWPEGPKQPKFSKWPEAPRWPERPKWPK